METLKIKSPEIESNIIDFLMPNLYTKNDIHYMIKEYFIKKMKRTLREQYLIYLKIEKVKRLISLLVIEQEEIENNIVDLGDDINNNSYDKNLEKLTTSLKNVVNKIHKMEIYCIQLRTQSTKLERYKRLVKYYDEEDDESRSEEKEWYPANLRREYYFKNTFVYIYSLTQKELEIMIGEI